MTRPRCCQLASPLAIHPLFPPPGSTLNQQQQQQFKAELDQRFDLRRAILFIFVHNRHSRWPTPPSPTSPHSSYSYSNTIGSPFDQARKLCAHRLATTSAASESLSRATKRQPVVATDNDEGVLCRWSSSSASRWSSSGWSWGARWRGSISDALSDASQWPIGSLWLWNMPWAHLTWWWWSSSSSAAGWRDQDKISISFSFFFFSVVQMMMSCHKICQLVVH